MTLTRDHWRSLYNLFDPRLRLGEDAQDLYVQRPGHAAGRIREDLRLGLDPDARWVLCGSMGSGKSTELVHLGRLLQDDFAVIGVDIFRSTAQMKHVTGPEVIFLIGAAAVQTASERWGQPVPDAARDGLIAAFRRVLRDSLSSAAVGDLIKGVALFTANVAAPGSAAVIGAITGAAQATGALATASRGRPTGALLGGLTRQLREGEPDLEALVDAVNAVLLAVAEIRPPVVLVDGLDKLDELAAIRELFTSSRVLSRLIPPVVYAAPISLMLSTEWQAAGGAFKRERLTNVVVHKPGFDWIKLDEATIAQGRAALRRLVSSRLARLDLQTEDTVFEEGALDAIIDASGGLLRDLVHLVNRAIREVLLRGSPRIGREEAQAAITEIRKEYEITFTTERIEELRHVARHGEPSGASIASFDLLAGGYVLPYANGRVWFEPHPILRGLRPGL